jgi:PAS domain S-box-containing protein
MHNFTEFLFSSSGYLPSGYCLDWNPVLVLTYVFADFFLAVSYFSVAIALYYFMRGRPGFDHGRAVLLLTVFCFLAGGIHALEILTVWQPAFGVETVAMLLAAATGIIVMSVFWRLIPKLKSLPSVSDLTAVNAALEREIVERRAAEERLQHAEAIAEVRLNRRTAELTELNLNLARQVAQYEETAHKLSETTEQFMDLADRTRTGVVHVTPDGVVRWSSLRYAEILGIDSPDGLVGRKVDEWVIEPDREAIQAFRRAVLLGNHSLIEKRIRRADGAIIDVEILAALSRARGETIIVSFVRDITKRKTMEREAERIRTQLASSNQDLERFASIASHDLNAPLRHLRIVLESLMEDSGGALDEGSRQLLEQGHQAALRMSNLVRDLLQFSRIDSMTFNEEEVKLDEVIRAGIESVADHLNASDARIEVGEMPTVTGNGSALTHLWQNLISNAITYRSKRTPEIRISATEAGGGWEIAIADNGIGVPNEHAERIFEMHTRLHAYKNIPGTGIGLAACRRIAEAHGGRIWLDTGYADGSRFVIWLPKQLAGREFDIRIAGRRNGVDHAQQHSH